MSNTSRRGFISLAGAGTVAGLAVAAVPGVANAAPEDASLPKGAAGSMAAYVHDVHKGEVALLVEGHEVIVTDKVLTARIVRAYHSAKA